MEGWQRDAGKRVVSSEICDEKGEKGTSGAGEGEEKGWSAPGFAREIKATTVAGYRR